MSEKDKEIAEKIAENMEKLSDSGKCIVLGYAQGFAAGMAEAARMVSGDEKKAG